MLLTAHHAYARSARGGDRVDEAQVSAGYRIHAGCVSTGAERRALGPNGSWQSAAWARNGRSKCAGIWDGRRSVQLIAMSESATRIIAVEEGTRKVDLRTTQLIRSKRKM